MPYIIKRINGLCKIFRTKGYLCGDVALSQNVIYLITNF
jgi:hypothetical protein